MILDYPYDWIVEWRLIGRKFADYFTRGHINHDYAVALCSNPKVASVIKHQTACANGCISKRIHLDKLQSANDLVPPDSNNFILTADPGCISGCYDLRRPFYICRKISLDQRVIFELENSAC